jgi:hypothetical protein
MTRIDRQDKNTDINTEAIYTHVCALFLLFFPLTLANRSYEKVGYSTS